MRPKDFDTWHDAEREAWLRSHDSNTGEPLPRPTSVRAKDLEARWTAALSDVELRELLAFDDLAEALAKETAIKINESTAKIHSTFVRYKAQYTLELLIEKLQARV